MKTSEPQPTHGLTDALEDYLETIFELLQEQHYARVRDIAKARSVRSASVTPAMRRLDELGLIRYIRREYITLTEEGQQAARRIVARHQLLRRFFSEFLKVPASTAAADACAMEHSLSAETMDRLVRFFEYVDICPHGQTLIHHFHQCDRVHDLQPLNCSKSDCQKETIAPQQTRSIKPISELTAGEKGRVTQVNGRGAIRQRLLEMGILPNVIIKVERWAPAGDLIWIKLQGFQLSLRRKEADCVLLEALAG
jgi:DtxR family Mn-dependent transcriptional regulator